MNDDLELVKRARPEVAPATRETRARARRALDEAIVGHAAEPRNREKRRRPGLGAVALALSVAIVVAVVAVFLGLRARPVVTGAGGGGREFVFHASPAAANRPLTASEMEQTVLLVRRKLTAVFPGVRVSSMRDELIVRVPRGALASVAEVKDVVESSDELLFYDWEANVLTPAGKPASALLQAGDPAALKISEGGPTGTGMAGAGSMSLYEAVRLAASRPAYVSNTNAHQGPEYFMFGEPETQDCVAADRRFGVARDQPCYLAGPAPTRSQLDGALPPGVSRSSVRVLKVNQGWEVVEAAYPAYRWPPLSDPSAQFFVLRDHVAVSGSDISNPRPSTDQTGAPDVSFGFTSNGAHEFQNVTAAIAKRGSLLSTPARKLFQHFAVVLGTHLITVPYIDYTALPFGIPGNHGADIQGAFTRQTARRLAASIVPLPVRLSLVSVSGITQTPVAARCSAEDTTLSLGPSLPGMTGEHDDVFLLNNDSGRPCTIYGYPRVELVAGARPLPFTHRDGGGYVTSRAPAKITLAPEQRAVFEVAKYRCDLADVYMPTRISVWLPGSRSALTVGLTSRLVDPLAYCGPNKHDPGNELEISPIGRTLAVGAVAANQ